MCIKLVADAILADISREGRDDRAPLRKVLLIAFCNEAASNGILPHRFEGKASNPRLAATCMRSIAQMKEAKRMLVEDGWLTPDGVRRGYGRVARYRVNVGKLRDAARAREADAHAIEPSEAGIELDVKPKKISGRKSRVDKEQDIDQQTENKDSGRTSENPPLVAGSQPSDGRKSGHNPIGPASFKVPPDGWPERETLNIVVIRDALRASIGENPALSLIVSARFHKGVLLFSDRFAFYEARDRYAELLSKIGVSVIARDEHRSDSIALDKIDFQEQRAAS